MKTSILKYHLELLDKSEEMFDSDLGLLAVNLDNPKGYHTKLKKGRFHRIVDNGEYAVALLDGGRERDRKRAISIIRKIIDKQDKREGETFGLWPYYFEENIDDMSPPDYNMADFNCLNLLQVLRDYSELLDEQLLSDLKKCCIDACRCIIKRNVPMSYTNVAIVGTYVTLLAGEMISDEIFEYAKKRLEKFYIYVKYTGYFDEYNSPCYSVILVNILGLMFKHIKDKESFSMIEELNDMAWKMVAEHFHVPTKQWAGPQLRAYTDYITDEMLSFFELALDFEIKLTDNKKYGFLDMRNDVKCPQKYKKYFVDSDKKYFLNRLLSRGHTYPYYGHSRVEMSYMSKEFTLGTFNRCECWNQHRMLLSYIGDTENIYCMRLRVLHDFYDYSSALFGCVQKENCAAGQIVFCNDRGDTHCNIDRINGKIRAKDLRVRFSIEGDISKIKNEIKDNILSTNINNIYVSIGFPYAVFDDHKIEISLTQQENLLCFDAVLYSGEEKEFDFDKIEKAVVAIMVVIGQEEYGEFKTKIEDEHCISVWNINNDEYRLSCLFKPQNFINHVLDARQYINNVWVEDKAVQDMEKECENIYI